MTPKRCAKCSAEQWVTVIINENGPYCVLGPYVLEDTAETLGKAFVEFMEKESVGGVTATTLSIVTFEDARDKERRFNTSIAGEDVEDEIDRQIHEDLANGEI